MHDGGDYLGYASAKTVLDNLIHRLDVAETVVAFVSPGDRLTEYANSAAHARYLTAELLPRLEAEFPLAGTPSARCLMGASFGAVAALSITGTVFGIATTVVNPPAAAAAVCGTAESRAYVESLAPQASAEALHDPTERVPGPISA